MKIVGIVIGHGPKIDTGAVSVDGNETELAWNRELAFYICKFSEKFDAALIHRKVEKLPPYAEVNSLHCDLAIELHLNSSDPAATGSEMIHYAGSTKGKQFAELLLTAAVSTLKLKNRGVKTPWQGRGNAFLKNTRCPAVIVESFFINNPSDLARGAEVQEDLARAYVHSIDQMVEAIS